MCGIAGWWDRDGAPSPAAALGAMLDALAHRGPDDRGTWRAGPISLGHVRLTILDMSARAHQPFVTADGDGVLTYNGEVYNFPELRRELEGEGVCFTSTGDSEVVLHALHRWGPEAALPRLNGMFAFAYFDRRSHTLWLARDRLGIKPLYVAETGRQLLFASEIKALLRHPDVTARPDVPVLTAGLTAPYVSDQRTEFLGIESLLPGTCWKVGLGSRKEIVYFDVLQALDPEKLQRAAARPLADLTADFGAMLAQSVDMHLASDAPLAAACSGGLDSSYVTALASERIPETPAYVADVSVAATRSADGEHAQRVAEHLGTKLTNVSVGPDDLLRHWPTACWLTDGPSYAGSDVALLMLNRAMHDDGIKVAVTGEGADELLAGYKVHRSTVRRWRRWRRRPRQALLPAAWHPSAPPGGLLGPRVGLPPATRALLEEPEDRYAVAARRYAALFERLDCVQPAEARALLARCLFDLTSCLTALLRRMDRLGLGASVEMRVPFLENRIIDFAMHLPFAAKLNERQPKWLLKQLAARRLPPDVVFAEKRAFPVPWACYDGSEALLHGGALGEILSWDRQRLARAVASCGGVGHARFRLVSLEVWGRIFLRGESPDEVGERLVACRSPRR
jgi:asparagine synthase (glutamine-hydrolysing)